MRLAVWLIVFLLVGTSSRMQAGPPPSADEILSRVVARDHVLQQRRKNFDYDLAITREKLDASNHVTEKTTEKTTVFGDKRPDYGSRSDPSLRPDDEARKQSHEEPFELLNIIHHYDYTLEGEETVDGVPCYRVRFSPKPDMPYANREEKVLNAVEGHIWASRADYSLIRDEGALLHPVSVAWVFASLVEMHFRFDAMPLPNGDYGPAQVQYSYRVSLPFFDLHERDTRTMSNYRTAQAAK